MEKEIEKEKNICVYRLIFEVEYLNVKKILGKEYEHFIDNIEKLKVNIRTMKEMDMETNIIKKSNLW